MGQKGSRPQGPPFDWDDYYRRMTHANIYSDIPLDLNQFSQELGISQKVQHQTAGRFQVPFKIEGDLICSKTALSFNYQTKQPCTITLYVNAKEQCDGRQITIRVAADRTETRQAEVGKGTFEVSPGLERGLIIVKLSGRESSMFYYCYVRTEGAHSIGRYKLERDGRGTHVGRLFNKGTCVVCMCEQSNTVIKPCKHMCLCKDCSTYLLTSSKLCPVCRTVIAELVAVQ